MRFCSRCGLAMTGLAEWLAGGTMVVKRADPADLTAVTRRRKNMRRAAKLMFFSGVLFPIFLVISLAVDEGGPMFIPFFVFFVSLVWMLYARLFSDNTPLLNYQAPQTTVLSQASARGSLPPAQTTSIPGVGRQQVRTNELAQPPSVTENTTKFFNNE
ncbi:MAG TPA: hypothetical protein VFS90_11010 [Pyrinomonadaceae bacterium]|nr:hypothetical protein [Pyrinomonadaceae bacterium]